MPLLILSLGSNIDAPVNIASAITALRREFGELALSTVYESEAVGFSGNDFLNMVASVDCNKPLADITGFIRQLENSLGRDRAGPRFSDRTIDIDILVYGDETGGDCGLRLPRADIGRNAFVLRPLAEMHGDLRFAGSGPSCRELWERFDKQSQKIRPTRLRF